MTLKKYASILVSMLLVLAATHDADGQTRPRQVIPTDWSYDVNEHNASCFNEYVQIAKKTGAELGCRSLSRTTSQGTSNFHFGLPNGGTLTYITDSQGFDLRNNGEKIFVLDSVWLRSTKGAEGVIALASGQCFLEEQVNLFEMVCKGKTESTTFSSSFSLEK